MFYKYQHTAIRKMQNKGAGMLKKNVILRGPTTEIRSLDGIQSHLIVN